MFKKLLFSFLLPLLISTVSFAQAVTVSSVVTNGRFLSCGTATPTVTFVRDPLQPSSGTHVSGGSLVVDDLCDTTRYIVNITNLRWNQTPGVEWIHGLFFPSAFNYSVTGTSLPSGWATYTNCTGAPCSAAISGGPGFYYDGTTAQSCCTNSANDGIPANNWGVGAFNCTTTPLDIQFTMRICNSLFTGNSYTFRMRGTSDGGTGCWNVPDATTNNNIDFTVTTTPAAPLYNNVSVPGPITKTCSPTPTYSVTLNAGCGNGNTVTWWTALTGGTQIGTGSPFVYTSSTCPAGVTLYAACCPNNAISAVCSNRKAVQIPATLTCPPNLALDPPTVTQPSCSDPTAGAATVQATAGTSSGTVTYTINPGGTSNTSGQFGPGLTPGSYTVTAVDGTGCSASTTFTINTAATGGAGPTVTSPVTYCQNATASPLTASGTNLLWYTTATGGTGSSTAPTPSTATPGTTSYYVSQNPSGNCESQRSQIDVIVTANSTIALSSAAGTDNQTVCVNTAITNITYQTGLGATGATVTGLPAGVTGTYSGGTNGTFTISGTPTATGTYSYTVTTSGGCGAATATGTITVSTAATMTLTSAPSTTSQTVCINTSITDITYNVGGGATGATATGLPAGVTGTYAAGVFTISGTPTAAGTFNYSVSTTGGCGTVTLTGTITVNPNVTLTLTSGAATTSQTVCVNTAITNITYSTANGATGATVTGLPAGVTGTYSGGTNGTVTISGTPTATGTFNYTVTTSGGCTVQTLTGSITVDPTATITLTSAPATTSQTVCINTAITDITYAVGGSATGATVTGLPAGVTGTFAGGTFTISGTPTASGTFNYTVTTTGGSCGTPSLSGTITVTPNATIALTSAAGTDAQTVCNNAAITNITYSVGGSATGATVTGLPAGVTGTYAGGVFTISGSPTANGTFNYTVTTSGGCTVQTATGSITVNPNATIALTSAPSTTSQTVCINTAITNITYSIGGSATGATVTGLPAGVTGTYAGGVFTISGTPTATGTFNYTVTTTGGSCGTPSLSGTITVNPDATLTLTSGAGSNTQTVCINTAISNITYSVGGGGTGATVTGLPAGVSGTYAGGVFTISGTPTATGTFNYTVTTTGGGCIQATATGTITVNANTTITLTSAAGTNNQTVNINTAITTITYGTANGVTGATITGLPTGVTGTYSGGTNGTFTISGTPTVSGVFNYTITTSGGCGTATATGTIIVNDLTGITLTSAAGTDAQTLCINTPLTNIVYTTSGGATGASITAGALPAGVTGTYSGGTNGTFTISGTPTASGTFTYTVSTSGGVGTASASGSITVNPNVTMTLSSAASTTSQTVCINTAITNITYTTANGVTGATVTGLPTGVTGTYSGGTNGTVTISGTPTVSGPFNYTVTTSGGCSTATQTGTITVNPATTITLSSAAGTDAQTVCINAAITNITYSTANGATNVTVTGLPAGVTGSYSGGTNGTFTISGSPSASGTFNYTVTTTGGCSTDSKTGTITVNPIVTLTLSSAPATTAQTLCINTALTNITYTTANGVTGATVTGLPAGVTGTYSGGTNGTVTISGTPTAAGTFNYTVTTSGGCGTAALTGTITVQPATTITLTSPATTAAQTVCINTAITNIVYTTANGATGASATGLPAGVTGTYSGGTNGTFTISGTPTAAGTFNYTVTTSGGCGTATATGSITVNPDVTLTLTSTAGTDAQTICINTALTNITYAGANGVTGISITAGALPAGVTGTYSGSTNGTFTISGTPTVAGTFNYTLTTSGGCNTATLSGTITVNPATTITLSSAPATTSQTLCINTAITNITYTTANGATGVTATNLPAGVTGTYSGGTNGTFTISGTPTVSGTFNYTVTTSGGCGTATLNGTINVNPNVTLTLSSAAGTDAQTICINTALTNITYSTANGVTGATITAGALPAGVTGTYSGGTNGTFTISGTPTVAGTFNYTITTTGGCSTDTKSGTITVNPDMTLTLSSAAGTNAQDVCINTAITDITYSAANGATGATVTGLPAGVTGSYAGGTFTISGTPTVAGTFNYTVNATGGCGTATLSGTIIVRPATTITLTSAAGTDAQTVCINTAITNIVYSTANGATNVTVTGLPTGVTGTYSGGTNGTFTISGTPSVAGTFNYTVTTSGGCGTATLSGTITVNPDVTITLSSAAGTDNQTACINAPITNITYSTANGVTGASTTGLPSGVTGTFAGGTYTISGTPTVAGTFNYTVTTSGGCNTATANGTIIVDPATTITLTSAPATTSQVLCENTAITNITYSTANGATNVTASGLPTGVTGTYSGGTNGTFTISGTATSPGVFNYTVSTVGGCGTATLNGTINVVAIPPAPGVTTPVNYCPNDPATPLTAVGTNLLWYTTATGGTGSTTAPTPSTSTPGTTTSYYVSQTTSTASCEGPRAQIDVVVANPIVINTGGDQTICQGDTAHFFPTVNPPAASYQWAAIGAPNNTIVNPNVLNGSMFPVDTTSYILHANLGGCSSSATVTVNVRWKPIIEAGPNVALCLDRSNNVDSLLLTASISHYSTGFTSTYGWYPTDSVRSPHQFSTYVYPTRTTWYKFVDTTTVADYGCNFITFDSVKVVVNPIVHAYAGHDTIGVLNQLHQLHGTGGVHYLWSSPTMTVNNATSQNATAMLTNDANFFLEVRDAIGCVGYDSVFVQALSGPTYHIPNAFSPNGDGLNDVFRPIPAGMSTTTYFRVFNRYGQMVFETNQWLKGWDGFYKGTEAPTGAYVWMVKGMDRNKKIIEMTGTVLLVR